MSKRAKVKSLGLSVVGQVKATVEPALMLPGAVKVKCAKEKRQLELERDTIRRTLAKENRMFTGEGGNERSSISYYMSPNLSKHPETPWYDI